MPKKGQINWIRHFWGFFCNEKKRDVVMFIMKENQMIRPPYCQNHQLDFLSVNHESHIAFLYQIGAVWKSESNSLIKVGRGTEFDHVFRSLPSSKQSQDTFTRVVHIIHTTKVTVWCWVTPKLTCITAGWKMMLLQATVVSLNCHLWRRNSSARRQYHIYTQGFYHHHWCCHFHGPPNLKNCLWRNFGTL